MVSYCGGGSIELCGGSIELCGGPILLCDGGGPELLCC